MAVKTYSYKKSADTKLSTHFKVKEFRCKDGSDKILIDSDLVELLEKVYKHFNASSISITSAYRTPSHDKRVGGKGSGNHVEGKAADFKVYNKKKELIPSKEIALYLEDIGAKGIGYRCGGSSTATHVDVNYRTKNWYGDEKKSMSASIGKSFYDYLDVDYSTKTIKVTTSLKVRKEPGLNGKTVKKLPNKAKIQVANTMEITKDNLTWVRVKLDGEHYWVAKKYLK